MKEGSGSGQEGPAIEIIPRGQQAAATRHKAEEAAERALMQHARFQSLEAKKRYELRI